MANQAISQLPVAIALVGNELVPIVQQGATYRTTTGAIATLAQTTALPSLGFAAPLSRSGNTVSLSSWTATVDQGVLYRASSAALTSTAAGLVGQLLTGNGLSAAPSWLAAGTTGQILLGNTSASAVWLSAGVAGQLLVSNTTAQVSWLAAGVSGQVLVGQTNAVPIWTNISALPIDLDIGSSTITGGVSGRVLYDNSGILGEMLTTGTGTTLVLSVTPTISSPTIIGPTITGGTLSGSAITASTVSGSTLNNDTITNATIITATISAGTLLSPTITGPLTYNGTTLAPAVSGTSAMVASRSPSFTGTILGESLSLTSGAVVYSSTAIPAGGTLGMGYLFSSTPNFGDFFGSGLPTLQAAAGSTYHRSDGGISAPVYANVSSSVVWTQLLTAGGFRLVISTFTASTTWTPQGTNMFSDIQGWGGGGGGGGVANTAASIQAQAGSGGAGGMSRIIRTRSSLSATMSVTIGAAGTAASAGANAGGNGGDTSVGALLVAKGGSGGGAGSLTAGGAGGIFGTGDEIGTGAPGSGGVSQQSTGSGNFTLQSVGGSTSVGGGGRTTAAQATGGDATGYGAGGAGGSSSNAGGAAGGGAGTVGYVVIIEYCSG